LARWSESDLETRLCRALDIAKTTVDYFALDGYTDEKSPAYSFGPEKVVAEAAMLAHAASACGLRPNVAGRVDELARLLIPHARSERVLVDIAMHPALVFKFALPHVLLSRLGYCDAGFDDFLKSCVSAHSRYGRDRSPSESVERNWIWSLWTGQAGSRSEQLESVLNWPIDILGGLRDDCYAFTHLIFYCTDFGSRSCRLPRGRSIILGEAHSLLARYLDAEDYDLAGEILMAWPLLAATWSPAAAFGFRVLSSVEDEAGVLPCGNINLGRLTQLDGVDRTRYALGTAYHTALVMGFLCAASLRPGRVPPARIVGSQFDETCLSRVLRYIDDDQGHWQSEFSRLGGREQRALTPFILDIAIVQRNRKRDYEAVNELLSIASEYGIADSPLCGQAAELLERIAHCSSACRARTSMGVRD
jgi:hypothetical protein